MSLPRVNTGSLGPASGSWTKDRDPFQEKLTPVRDFSLAVKQAYVHDLFPGYVPK